VTASKDAGEDTASATTAPTPAWGRTLLWALGSAACFQIAHLAPYGGFALVGFFIGLLNLSRLNNARHGFRWGVGLGWMVYTPHLLFFWHVFVPEGAGGLATTAGVVGVFALWMVLPVWLGVFLCLASWLRRWTGPRWWAWLIPVVWTGVEYGRGELYPLKFSWLSAGYAFADAPWMVATGILGMYGVGFVLMAATTLVYWAWNRSPVVCGIASVWLIITLPLAGVVASGLSSKSKLTLMPIAGVQLEFPNHWEVLAHLDRLIAEQPQTELCVLSEYTFRSPVPQEVLSWCRTNHRYLVVGGLTGTHRTNSYNTVFVIGPDGAVVFEQAKCVPIQFMNDGLPAPHQKVWDSPWGRIGLCICYDLSYTRVTDELVRQGAQALIVPTMDVETWGPYQHWLHGRVAPIRAAEYGIPIFRLASSGISQHVLRSGRVAATASVPGQGDILAADLELRGSGRLPIDRWLAPGCVVVTAVVALIAGLGSARRWWATRRTGPTGHSP
jgi:apolipoprotein N-acyltransferase